MQLISWVVFDTNKDMVNAFDVLDMIDVHILKSCYKSSCKSCYMSLWTITNGKESRIFIYSEYKTIIT